MGQPQLVASTECIGIQYLFDNNTLVRLLYICVPFSLGSENGLWVTVFLSEVLSSNILPNAYKHPCLIDPCLIDPSVVV